MSFLSSSQVLRNRIKTLSKSRFPPPTPPSNRKNEVFKAENFSDIDKHAENAPADLLIGGVDKLLDYLRQRGVSSELHLLRAIFTWLGNQDFWWITYALRNGAVDSMYSFLGATTAKEITINELFQFICLAEQHQTVRPVKIFDDFYFLTDPDIFIHKFFPKEPAWQLLKEPWTRDTFLQEPTLYKFYFTSPWRLSDQKEHKATSRMTAVNGKCSVTFVKPEGSTTLKYRLYFNEERSKNKLPEAQQLTDYILINNNCIDKTQALTTRLPVNGLYRLEIMDERGAPLCLINIEMKQNKGLEKTRNKSENFAEQQKLPPGSKIYGPDQAAVDMGLVDISREEGVLVAREGEKIRMTFRSRRPLEVKVFLLHASQNVEDLSQRVTTKQEGDDVNIDITVPYDAYNPEYAVQIQARDMNSQQEFATVLNYLLTPDEELVDTQGDKTSNKSKNFAEQQKLPPGNKIYGPDQAAVDMGLVDISREEGVLVAREGEKIRMTFRPCRPLEVKISLLHTCQEVEDLSPRVTTEQEGDDARITAPVNGTFHRGRVCVFL